MGTRISGAARPPVAERPMRRLLDRAPGAAAADPAGQRAVGPDQRLGCGLAAAAATVLPTVASTNGSPARISSAMPLTTSPGAPLIRTLLLS
jgi:hypothetical protein